MSSGKNNERKISGAVSFKERSILKELCFLKKLLEGWLIKKQLIKSAQS